RRQRRKREVARQRDLLLVLSGRGGAASRHRIVGALRIGDGENVEEPLAVRRERDIPLRRLSDPPAGRIDERRRRWRRRRGRTGRRRTGHAWRRRWVTWRRLRGSSGRDWRGRKRGRRIERGRKSPDERPGAQVNHQRARACRGLLAAQTDKGQRLG